MPMELKFMNYDRPIRTKRSRNGCFNCKRLRIKCDEARPICEYCLATNKTCTYPSHKKKSTELVKFNKGSALDLINRALAIPVNNYDKLLNSASKIMPINATELCLLKFFDIHCISLLTFEVNNVIENSWRVVAPRHFLRSKLLRLSIYSFSCLMLSPLSQLAQSNAVLDEDDQFALSKWNLVTNSFSHPIQIDSGQLSITTIKYFLSCLKEKVAAIDELTDTSVDEFEKHHLSVELNLSGILIFGFLCLHNQKIVTMLSLDNTNTCDFLSICEGMNSIRALSNNETGFSILNWANSPAEVFQEVRVTSILEKELSEYYEKIPIDSTSSEDCEQCSDVIQVLARMISIAGEKSYPIPIVCWLLVINQDFFSKIRSLKLFPLRILYVYSCYSSFAGIAMDPGNSLWFDFAKWFKNYNETMFGGWMFNLDAVLFELMTQKFIIRYPHYGELVTLDPSSKLKSLFQAIKKS